jgi:hypothetical protein
MKNTANEQKNRKQKSLQLKFRSKIRGFERKFKLLRKKLKGVEGTKMAKFIDLILLSTLRQRSHETNKNERKKPDFSFSHFI